MKLIGLSFVRNEQWVLGLTLPAAMTLLDELVVIDHESSDRTPEIIAELARAFPGRIHPESWAGDYHEVGMRQKALDVGRQRGGTHFYWLDGDEVLTANLVARVRQWVGELSPGQVLELPWLAMWASLDRFRDDDSVWTNNFKAFAFADSESIAYRTDGDGYHLHLQTPRGRSGRPFRPLPDQAQGGVMHLQFANQRRLIAKHAWYKMFELLRFPGRRTPAEIDVLYSQAVDPAGVRLADVPSGWWAGYERFRQAVRLDETPWHEEEIRRMWVEHGSAAFAGLNLWGLPERLAAHEAVEA